MDLATLLGLLGAFGIVAMAIIVGGSAGVFLNVPSILIVVIGSLMVVMMKFSLGQFFGAVKIAVKAFMYKIDSPEEVIKKAVELADIARKGGLLSLEEVKIENPFLAKGVQYLVDGLEPEVVRGTLMKEMSQTIERHELGQRIFKALGDVAPAMGMIGTLVGLVQMLSAMDDPKKIGPAMAIALLTTLYGAVIANMIALPIADKLELRSNEELLVKSLIIDALSGIQSGQNPRVIEQLLLAYLPTSRHPTKDEE